MGHCSGTVRELFGHCVGSSMAIATSYWLSAFWIIFSRFASNLSTIAMFKKGIRPCYLRLTFWMTKRLMVLV